MTLPLIDTITSSIKAVVFDLDGTLYDKHCLPCYVVLHNLWALPLLAAERKTRKRLRGQYYGSVDAFYTAFFAEMSRGHCFSERMARRWYLGYYMPSMVKIIEKHCRLNDGVENWLSECRERHIKVVVYSDYGCVKEKLQALGLPLEQFSYIVSAPELGGLKPAKLCAEKVVANLQFPASACLFVGDRIDTDEASARAIGAQFALVQ